MLSTIKYILHGLSHNADGTFSSTKVYQGLGYVTCMYVIVWLTWNDKMTYEYLLIMLAATAGGRSFQTYLASKSKNHEPTP